LHESCGIRVSQALFGLSEEQIYNYVQFLREISQPVIPDTTLSVAIRDPKDIVVLQTAVSGEADIICTVDKHFYDIETVAFCAALGIAICDDREISGDRGWASAMRQRRLYS
jgi:predicted nucleic acid-binding protein